ncbi:MAG: hypothetical protein ACE5EF_00485 [Dehalococcoidia bacterium]
MAGVIPPHFPDAAAEDWSEFYEQLPETGTLLGVYTNWADSEQLASRPPAVFEAVSGPTSALGVTVVAAVGIHRTAGRGVVEPTLRLGDDDDEAALLTAVDALARGQHPAYLAIGAEVNLLAAADPDAFERFVSLYRRAYDTVKEASPGTLVFTIFQYEHLHGGAFLMDGVRDRPPTLDLIERFEGKLDLLGLTTYPFFDYESPADLPDDYYEDVLALAGVPLAFTEIGWPAAPLISAPDSGFGGTPEEQADFVDRFRDLIAGLDVEIALWSFPNDPAGVGAPFESVALRDNSGNPRPALARWQSLGSGD